MLAPIILFIYNRSEHTQKTLLALSANFLAKESILYIYADGPKQNASEKEKRMILETRKVALSEKWCGELRFVQSDDNKGLADSIITGVTDVVSEHGKVIVLEDDLVTSPYFLTYMNDALNLYEKNERVISVHGYVYPVKKKLPDYFFLRGADCWGWATWKRGWDLFNSDAKYLLAEITTKKLQKQFNFNDSFDYTGMLQKQIDEKISSWAIRWYASAFLANKFTLYSGTSFVDNIGFDGSGSHRGNTHIFKNQLTNNYIPVSMITVSDSIKARKSFIQYFRKNISKKDSYALRVMRYFIKKFIKKHKPDLE